MPDKINILKISVIAAVGAASLFAAAKESESYAAQAAAKEKTLAEAVMQNQLRTELKKAEEQARKELEEQGEALVTTVMETKPPVTETAAETTAETTTETTTETTSETTVTTAETTAPETVTETETSPADEIITEFTRGGLLPEDRSGIPLRTMFGLSEDEQKQVVDFLTEHYFLDGFKYAEEETRPELKEKKLLAAQMESSAVESLNLVLGGINGGDVSALLTADYGSIKADAESIRDEFAEKYADAEKYGEQYAALYEDSLKYFDRLIEALGKSEDTARQYNEAANPLLALGLLTSSVNDVLMPEMMAVLEESFDLVETSQEIFLEGTQGTKLLSRDEVRDIIENPGLALFVSDASKNTEDTQTTA